MVDVDELPAADKTLLGAGIVLVVDLVFLPWHSFEVGVASVTWSAIEQDGAIFGIGALLLTVAVVAVTALRVARPDPDAPDSRDRVVSGAALAVLALLVAKLATEAGSLGVGAWLGVALAAAMAVGGRLRLRDAAAGATATGVPVDLRR